MRKLYLVRCTILILILSCDPSQDLDAVISNRTNQDLKVNFVSSFEESKSIEIEPISTEFYIKGTGNNSLGGVFFTLIQFDSIYISKNDDVLKVYKENNSGKNIYNIERYWKRNASKSLVTYTYEITAEDIK